jgi:hypothetical protein
MVESLLWTLLTCGIYLVVLLLGPVIDGYLRHRYQQCAHCNTLKRRY